MSILAAIVIALAGCGRDNGLPADLASHLAARGITIHPSRAHAPLSRRDGYIVAPYDATIAARIVAAFGLERMRADTPAGRLAVERAGVARSPKEPWGAAGRPAQFRLRDGGQLQYFFLLVTTDGWMYLLAEYAYG